MDTLELKLSMQCKLILVNNYCLVNFFILKYANGLISDPIIYKTKVNILLRL